MPGPSAGARTFSSTSDTTLLDDAASTDLFGNLRDAVIGAQPDHVVAATDGRVEVIEERADRPIEADQRILNLVAARTVDVADTVDRREAHAEEIGRATLPELQRVDRRRCHSSEVLVRVRGSLPPRIESRIGLATRLGERMREGLGPARHLSFAFSLVVTLIGCDRQRALPDFVVVRGEGIARR